MSKAKASEHVKKNVVAMTSTTGALLISIVNDVGYGEHIGPIPVAHMKKIFAKERYFPVHWLWNLTAEKNLPCPDCGLVNENECEAEDQRAIILRDGQYFIAHIRERK